jgi:hypothetical protein
MAALVDSRPCTARPRNHRRGVRADLAPAGAVLRDEGGPSAASRAAADGEIAQPLALPRSTHAGAQPLDWEVHLPTLKEMKRQGARVHRRTTSHGRRHDELERIMRAEPIDFVQFTYNVNDRQAEQRLLPLAAERRLRSSSTGLRRRGLFGPRTAKPMPGVGRRRSAAASWGPRALPQFVVSQPAVTCAIPATSKVAHLRESNMRASCRDHCPDCGDAHAASRRKLRARVVDIRALLHEFHRLHLHPLLQRFGLGNAVLRGELAPRPCVIFI